MGWEAIIAGLIIGVSGSWLENANSSYWEGLHWFCNYSGRASCKRPSMQFCIAGATLPPISLSANSSIALHRAHCALEYSNFY